MFAKGVVYHPLLADGVAMRKHERLRHHFDTLWRQHQHYNSNSTLKETLRSCREYARGVGKKKIRTLDWNQDGSAMLFCDDTGVVKVYNADDLSVPKRTFDDCILKKKYHTVDHIIGLHRRRRYSSCRIVNIWYVRSL